MSFSFFLGFCIFLIMPYSFASDAAMQIQSLRSRLGLNDSAILIEQGKQITIVGPITPSAALAFKDGIEKDKNIGIVRVDSPGGDMQSALDIALIIKSRKLNLVVDGQCFSACANFLFPAATTKIVLPGSFVGIHSNTYWYLEKGVSKEGTYEQVENVLKKSSDKQRLEYLVQLKINEKLFFEQLAITNDLRNSYGHYISNRIDSFGSEKIDPKISYPNCPPIQIWVLNKQQLTAMGIKGIGDFWFPQSLEEKKMPSLYFKLPQNAIFYGEAFNLEQICKNVSDNWFYRHFYEMKSYFTQ